VPQQVDPERSEPVSAAYGVVHSRLSFFQIVSAWFKTPGRPFESLRVTTDAWAAGTLPAKLTGRHIMAEHCCSLSSPLRSGVARGRVRAVRAGLLASIALALVGCGGRGTSSSLSGSVTIRVTTSAGTPLPDAWVGLNGNFDGRSAYTDAGGKVRFTGVPAGEASVNTSARGFHWAYSRFLVRRDANTDVIVILEQVVEGTPAVLSARTTRADHN
jgi:hypothetical protein